MLHILDEYGETILGAIAAFIIIMLAMIFLRGGSVLIDYISYVVNSAI